MKFLGLVVALLVSFQCCSAAVNRSSVWLIANTQIFTTNSQTPQSCFVSATGATASSSITLLTTSNLVITGTFIQLGQGVAGFVTSNSALSTLSLQFIYNSTYSLTLALPTHTLNTATPTALTVSQLFSPSSTTYWTSTVASSTTNPYPVVYGSNMIMSPTGSTWLTFQNIPGMFAATAAGAVAATSGIVITDYVSSSTIGISQWNDNSVPTATYTGVYNAFYQIGVRTKTSSISSSSSTLTNAASCTSTGRKRSLDHIINKRALTTCTTSSIDPSMSTSVLATACSSVTGVYAAAGSATKTQSDIGDAFNKGVTTMNAMYQADYAVFGAGSSKYVIAANFGMLIAMSSIIFSLLN